MEAEERKERRREYSKRYYEKHKAECQERARVWKHEHPDYEKQRLQKIKESEPPKEKPKGERHDYHKQYYATKQGRAARIVNTNNKDDRRNGLDSTNNVDRSWVERFILGEDSRCVYCGTMDWTRLGCDRIDNNKPHTADNIVCACSKCNARRQDKYTVEAYHDKVVRNNFNSFLKQFFPNENLRYNDKYFS